MRYISTAGEIKEIEKYVINEIGIPSLVLMERAALCVTGHIKKRFDTKADICVVCGAGNNGADGVTIARQLMEEAYKVDIVILGKKEKFSTEMKIQCAILEKQGVRFGDKIPDKNYDCFVDAILGVGLTREITDEGILHAIDTINASDAYIYSVDLPSGIHTDKGCIMGNAVKADETITFTCEKVGLCLHPGKVYAGRVHIENIGIWNSCIERFGVSHYGYNEKDGAALLRRDESGNKGTFGKVAVIAGNNEITGAAVLCAGAVLKSGAGMVKVLSNEKTLDIIRKILPEAMVQSLDDKAAVTFNIRNAIEWADSIVIGPGIGTDDEAVLKMTAVLEDFPKEKCLIVDADGINLISQNKALKQLTEKVNGIIYTPHMMELSRLLNMTTDRLKADLDIVMKESLEHSNAIFVCKDSVTRVYQNKQPIFINRIGNSGMATAGSGDVLAGIIGAVTARRGMDIYEGTVLGVHLHSLAGDLAACEYGKNSLLASDIIEALPLTLKKMEEIL